MTPGEPDDRPAARAFYGVQQRRRRQIQYRLMGQVKAGQTVRKPGIPTRPALLLRVLAGGETRRTVKLYPGRLIIGRAPGVAIQLKDDTVSSHHAVLNVTPDDVTIEDLKSTNGTSLNGTTIDKAQRLHAGDRLQLGNAVLMIEGLR